MVTGVSGSGKSTLVNDILFKELSTHFYKSREQAGKHKGITGLEMVDKVIGIDQSPIGLYAEIECWNVRKCVHSDKRTIFKDYDGKGKRIQAWEIFI